jgi:hypothetical protein
VKHTKRKTEDPYATLSAFIHGGYPKTMPTAKKPADIVAPLDVIAQLPVFIEAVSETLSDVFVSCHRGNWHSLPEVVRTNLNSRFSGKAKSKLQFD